MFRDGISDGLSSKLCTWARGGLLGWLGCDHPSHLYYIINLPGSKTPGGWTNAGIWLVRKQRFRWVGWSRLAKELPIRLGLPLSTLGLSVLHVLQGLGWWALLRTLERHLTALHQQSALGSVTPALSHRGLPFPPLPQQAKALPWLLARGKESLGFRSQNP